MRTEDLLKRKEALKAELKAIDAQIEANTKLKRVTCIDCGLTRVISKVTFVQYYNYRYKAGEWGWIEDRSYWRCPTARCNYLNWIDVDFAKYKHHFKDVEVVHK